MDTQVFGVSADTPQPAGLRLAEGRKVSDVERFSRPQYLEGLWRPDGGAGLAIRATFVIDKEGKIAHIEEGQQAVDIHGVRMAGSRLKK